MTKMNHIYNFNYFNAEWNEDLKGYIIHFKNGKVAYTQVYIELNRLHADYNKEFIERYEIYDDELNDYETKLVENFVKFINKLKTSIYENTLNETFEEILSL